MPKATGPIGIFDSGIGGLTVASAIQREIPDASLIYFGDTAHLPYGDKSAEAIRGYSRKITRFLIDQGCKSIVIACNTASSIAGKEVVDEAGPEIPVYNVIDPVAHHVADNYNSGFIGVIGTKGTIKTRAYPKVIEGLNKNLKVKSMATPLLVPMIEEGYFNNNISQTIINNYLSNRHVSGIQALILGCTHYPLIRKEVERYYKSRQVEVFDTASIVAKAIAADMQGTSHQTPAAHHFYVSDYTESFESSTKLFFGERIRLEVKNLWA